MKDKLSALIDGHLEDEAINPVLDAIRTDRTLRHEWAAYCMIGDALRGDRGGCHNMVARVMDKIEAEPTLLAPKPALVQRKQSGLTRSLMPLAASLMGVAAVGWVAHTLYAQSADAPRLAAAERAVQVAKVQAARAQELVRPVGVTVQGDPHREYLFAHQTMTGGGPLSGAIQHVRTVSDVRQDFAR